jgi:hypothetical protein
MQATDCINPAFSLAMMKAKRCAIEALRELNTVSCTRAPTIFSNRLTLFDLGLILRAQSGALVMQRQGSENINQQIDCGGNN